MVFPRPQGLIDAMPNAEPLGCAGAFRSWLALGVAAVIRLGSSEPAWPGGWGLAVPLVWVAIAVILMSAPLVCWWLGVRADRTGAAGEGGCLWPFLS